MALSDQKSATGKSAEDLVNYIDDQQNLLQKRQAADLARLGSMPEGPAREILTDAIKERGAVIDQNEIFKDRLNNGEHPGKVQWDMVEENAYMIQSGEKPLLKQQADSIPVSHTPLNPSVKQAQYVQLAEMAVMDANQIREKIDNAQIQVELNEEMAGYLADDGDHLMADVLRAEAKEAAKRAALLEVFEEAKLSGQPVNPQKLESALESLSSASSDLQQARIQADQQKRQLFQSEIAQEIGAQLDSMGLTPDEKAVVIKAVADYALDHDDNKPNVVNAQGVAQEALENLQAGGYQHPGVNDPSEQRIQDAARLALGMKQVVGQDGQIQVDRPGVKNLQEAKFQETLEAAKAVVNRSGPDAIIGQEAIQAGQKIKADLNNRVAQPAVQQEQAPSVEPGSKKTRLGSVRDSLNEAAKNIKNAAANAFDRKGSEQKLQEVPDHIKEEYKAEQKQLSALQSKILDNMDPAKMNGESPAKLAELQEQVAKVQTKMEHMKEDNPGLKQMDRSKVGQVVHSGLRDAAKSVGSRLKA